MLITILKLCQWQMVEVNGSDDGVCFWQWGACNMCWWVTVVPEGGDMSERWYPGRWCLWECQKTTMSCNKYEAQRKEVVCYGEMDLHEQMWKENGIQNPDGKMWPWYVVPARKHRHGERDAGKYLAALILSGVNMLLLSIFYWLIMFWAGVPAKKMWMDMCKRSEVRCVEVCWQIYGLHRPEGWRSHVGFVTCYREHVMQKVVAHTLNASLTMSAHVCCGEQGLNDVVCWTNQWGNKSIGWVNKVRSCCSISLISLSSNKKLRAARHGQMRG